MTTQIQAPSAESTLALSLEQFMKKANCFLQTHYSLGACAEGVEKMLKAIRDLSLEVDEKALEEEFELSREKQDLLADYYDSAWF